MHLRLLHDVLEKTRPTFGAAWSVAPTLIDNCVLAALILKYYFYFIINAWRWVLNFLFYLIPIIPTSWLEIEIIDIVLRIFIQFIIYIS